TTPDFWDRILALNLRGPIACTHAVLPHMIRQAHGKIVSIASDAGRVGSSGEAVYSAAKGGIIAFTKTIAREVARHRINVNCVCPGPSDTPLFQNEFARVSPKLAASLTRVIPWGRLGTPEDVAPAAVFPLDAIPSRIEVVTVDASATTRFEHRYAAGGRVSHVRSRAAPLSAVDVPDDWLGASLVLLAPVLDEVDPRLAVEFAEGAVAAAAQGWLRDVGRDGLVAPRAW